VAVDETTADFSRVATQNNRNETKTEVEMSLGYERRGFGGGNRFGPKPVEEGKEYDVDIKEISRRGEGIARIEGLVVFVPNTKPGDHVKVKITRVSNRFASGELVQ
jgi:predicted RNA-binding protein with TRAM domain